MSVLSHNCCPFVLYYTQFCSGTFLDSPQNGYYSRDLCANINGKSTQLTKYITASRQ